MRAALIAAAIVLAAPVGEAGAAGAAPARAAGVTGQITLTPSARGVTLSAKAPATRKGRAIALPVTAATLAGGAVVDTGGTLTLRAGKRRVTLAAARLTLGRRSTVSARLNGKRATILTLAPNLIELQAASLNLRATRVTLAKALQRRLRLKRAAFGTIKAQAALAAPRSQATTCRPTTAGGAPSDPGRGEPPVKSQPGGALPVTSATVTWHVRDSFIRYIASGEGTAAANGATAGAPEGTDPPLVYAFHFPSAGGWCDPATGAAQLTFTGTVGFRYRAHGIDLKVNDPEVELDGPASRVIFRMTGSGDTDGGNQRQVVETLDVSKAAVSVSPDGRTLTYDHIPAAVPPGAASSVFAGYYLPGDPFGWVSITFTTG